MSKQEKLVSRDTISGFHNPNDITDEGSYGSRDLAKRSASEQEQMNESITADWSKPGDNSRALGNAVSQLRKSIEKYSADDDGSR